ncbi:hypothetical protein [Microbulbifer thermotolerans]|uniref:hypothetical protein n=1 Tax=Microbulbifer thermotolerans TaxID=252514 RepID=UPI0022498B08|nr:hypothetical protein [Microbulbifer thermotolerans]MCX2831580.1 hypothetical protein [Microbulbifer thermotolerans]WKT59864.1 hypothetical protein Q2E61_13280 [Microbulbifer thermotolerans]
MVKLGQQLSFALDSGTSGCTGDVFSQLVDSRLALQVGVPGQVDNAHAASAERAFNLVAPQLFLFRFGDFHGFSVVGDYLLQKLQLPRRLVAVAERIVYCCFAKTTILAPSENIVAVVI